MRIKLVYVFCLALFQAGCIEKGEQALYEFRAICVENAFSGLDTCKEISWLGKLIENKELVYCEFLNNAYDTIFLPLIDTQCDGILIYWPDRAIEYDLQVTPPQKMASVLTNTLYSGKKINLAKGSTCYFYMVAKCPNKNASVGTAYYLPFTADSCGVNASHEVIYKMF